VRQLAVELSVNPNTIIKAYKELEIRGNLETQQGTGTFISDAEVTITPREKKRVLTALCKDLVGRAGTYGIELGEIIEALKEFTEES
jgi:GntR family transcriptional regulator